jgi:chorismate lyase/3-hydroxybenzoate synthase
MSNRLRAPLADAPGAWLVPLAAAPPAWVQAVARPEDRFRLVSAEVSDAEQLDTPQLVAAVAEAYGTIAASLRETGHHPVRFWNFVPAIHADMGDGCDRYMVFNTGRFAAFRDWFGSAAVFDRLLPTASAVGIAHGPLVVHGLASREPGTPVENPRQIPAYSYSRRFGPLPPCFARGTIIDTAAGRRLLVGGTASIVGELSQHERHLREQALETFDNLAHLIAAARGEAPAASAGDTLTAFDHVRVYIVRAEDAALVRELVHDVMPGVTSLEFARADLCRRELLVEIEGFARL